MRKGILGSVLAIVVFGATAYGQGSRMEGYPPAPRTMDDERPSAMSRPPVQANELPYVCDQVPPSPISVSTLPNSSGMQPVPSTSRSGATGTQSIRRVHDAEAIPDKPTPLPPVNPEGSHGSCLLGSLGCPGCGNHQGGSGDGSCADCGNSGGPFAWFGADYLHWRIRGQQQPALLNLISQAPCNCGNVDAVTIDGGGSRNMGWFDGVSLNAGIWLCDCWGIEGDFLALASRTVRSTFSSNGGFLLGIPFIDAAGDENNAIIMCPQQQGSYRSETSARLIGFEANLIHSGMDCHCFGCNWIAGFRYLQLAESLNILNQSHVWAAGCGHPIGTDIALDDDFSTRNNFYGPQIGVRCDWACCGCVTLNTSAKVAIGGVEEIVHIAGTNSIQCTNGCSAVTPGGFFAQPTNIGTYRHTDFCVVPEGNVGLDFALTCRIHANIGYSFLYMSNVVRPGDQIDRRVNLTQLAGGDLVGVASPHFDRHATDFWAHGVNVGMEIRF